MRETAAIGRLMSELIDVTQMYLRTIYELVEQGIAPRRARIVEQLGQASPTVSQTVVRLERDGLVRLVANRDLELTPDGLRVASAVMRRHRLAECMLIELLNLDWADIHDEACRWEHVISQLVEDRLNELLGSPTCTPYGTPIPAPGAGPEQFGRHLVSLASTLATKSDGASVLADQPAEPMVLAAVGETVQSDRELLGRLQCAGLIPGARFTCRQTDAGEVELRSIDSAEVMVAGQTTVLGLYLSRS